MRPEENVARPAWLIVPNTWYPKASDPPPRASPFISLWRDELAKEIASHKRTLQGSIADAQAMKLRNKRVDCKRLYQCEQSGDPPDRPTRSGSSRS